MSALLSVLHIHLRPPSQRHNLHTLRHNFLSELSGSLGDLGTLLPLLIALTLTNSISLSTTLVCTGLANIFTGLFFSIPLPVQPMKAIAAVAISRKFTIRQTESAGLFVGGVIAAASITGLLGWIGRVIPIPVVKGIQVGAGLSLVLSAGSSLLQPLGWTTPQAGDNLIWAIAAFLGLLLVAPWTRNARSKGIRGLPFALLIFILGLIISAISPRSHSAPSSSSPFFALWHPRTYVPSGSDFLNSALTAGLGQLPLTTLNSIIAVTHLSADLFPQNIHHHTTTGHPPAPTPTYLGLSVAAMNLVFCWFGSMPVCHGAGGLAAQHAFGARSGTSVVLLGLFKLTLGLFVNETFLLRRLFSFPHALLGIMVIAAGIQLAGVGEGLNTGARDLWIRAEEEQAHAAGDSSAAPLGERKQHRELDAEERTQRWTVMLVTVAGLLAFRNDAVGFVAGLLCHWSFRVPGWVERQRAPGAGGWMGWRLRAGEEEEEEEEERVGLLAGDGR